MSKELEKEYLEALGENIRYKKEYIGNDTYRLYIKKNEIGLLENYLTELEQIKNANPSEALEWLDKSKNMMIENNGDFIAFDCLKVYSVCKQALLKSQEQEKKNARLKEMLINGFRDKNGVFHKQTYLAFIDDEWCICDLKTDEWFLFKEVLECQKD